MQDDTFNGDWDALVERFLQTAPTNSETNKLSIKQLRRQVVAAASNNDLAKGLLLIQTHRALIEENIDSVDALRLIEISIQYGLTPLAQHLQGYAENYAGSYTNANIQYALGVAAFEQENFAQALSQLSSIDVSGSLNADRRDYATLLFGISLQHLRKHREAMKVYERIPAKSKYYAHGQLNLAVAYIRQGWWTDAQLAIEKAMQHKVAKSKEELTNRLYVVLGYSQLKNEFYRNARTSFRNITLDSQYMTKALLGIGLCALNQRDYLGALNAFDRLKASTHYDLTIAESNLLVPFTIERMGKLEMASAGYSEAIAYYEKKIREFESYQVSSALALPANDSAQHVLTPLNEHLQKRYMLLESLHQATQGTKLNQQASTLLSRLRNSIQRQRQSEIEQHLNDLKSYLSQSQYGFAKLYDENQ